MLAKEPLIGGIASSLLGSEPVPIRSCSRDTEVEPIPEELESPDKFENVHNFPEACVVEVPEVIISVES